MAACEHGNEGGEERQNLTNNQTRAPQAKRHANLPPVDRSILAVRGNCHVPANAAERDVSRQHIWEKLRLHVVVALGARKRDTASQGRKLSGFGLPPCFLICGSSCFRSPNFLYHLFCSCIAHDGRGRVRFSDRPRVTEAMLASLVFSDAAE